MTITFRMNERNSALSVCGVCLSVCLSVTFMDSVKTNKYIFKFFHRRVAKLF